MKHTWLLAGFIYINMTTMWGVEDVYETQAGAEAAWKAQLLNQVGPVVTFTTETLVDGTHRIGVHWDGVLYGYILEFAVK